MVGRIIFAFLCLCLTLCGPSRAEEPDLTLTATIDSDVAEPYVGEMVLVTLRGDYAAFITLERFEGVQLPNFTWIQLGRDVWSKGRKNGREYTSVERKLALYPEKAGPLSIGPFRHRLTLDDGNGKWTDTVVVSNTVSIIVQPKPRTNGDWWLPAKNISIDDQWDIDTERLADGATATRTVTITATGQTGAALPPPPKVIAPWLIAFIAPEERTTTLTRDGPVGTVRWQWRLRLSKSEPGRLPAYDIPWFDTGSRQMRNVIMKSRRFAYATATAPEAEDVASTPLLAWFLPLSLGLGLPVAAAMVGRRPLPPRVIVARLRQWLPERDALLMGLAVWRDDARTYRTIAARRLARHGFAPEKYLAAIDDGLFRPGAGKPVDLKALDRRLRVVFRQVRGTRP